MNKTISIDNDHDRICSTHVPETWAVASKNQRETQETEGVGEESKVEKNTCDEERRIIEACSMKKVNGYEAHEIEEIATKNDIQSEMAMDESMVDGHVETFLTLHLPKEQLRPRTYVRPKRREVMAKNRRSKLIHAMRREA